MNATLCRGRARRDRLFAVRDRSIGEPSASLLGASYDLIAQLTPLILEHEGRGTMAGLLQEAPETPGRQQLRLNGYVLTSVSSAARRRLSRRRESGASQPLRPAARRRRRAGW